MNIKKMFTALSAMVVAVTMIPGLTALAATPDTELGQAYEWAYANGITTMDSYEAANMTAPISRAQMAKMLSVYATKILGMTPDTSKDCTFSDIASVQGDLHDYIIESCQLGLMGQGITAFRPYDLIPRSEFGTALSRTLWGETYNGGTPFYAKHLDALKEAKIMTKIANAENTNEIRGYVMIMLQRAAEGGVDCDDTDVVLACLDDINNCPAACKAAYDEEDNTDTEDGEVVKSGSLVVTADSADDAKVFIGRASDLDVLTFKTSEEVEISKVILERYGYSTAGNVYQVWLENEDGKVITNKADLDSKGQAKLTLKKDYKKVDGELNATIVLWAEAESSTSAGDPEHAGYTITKPGATFWFKVVDVTSSAKNVDLDNYKPATYEAISYNGSTLTLVSRQYAAKTYNFSADESYEVLKYKIHTPDDAAVVVKGFTLKNTVSANKLDLNKYFNEAEITIAGEPVKKLKAEANKDNELVFSFSDVEIPAKTKAEVVVKISLTDDFDSFNSNNVVELTLTDLSAVDAKVSSRVAWDSGTWHVTTYTFKGGKIKLTNTKLGNIDAAQNSEDVVIAEGNIEVPETIKGTFSIIAEWPWAGALKQLTFVANGDETDANPVLTGYGTLTNKSTLPGEWTAGTNYATTDVAANYVTYSWLVYKCSTTNSDTTWTPSKWTLVSTKYVFTFNNVEIEKSGKVRFLADVRDATTWNSTSINSFTNFGHAAFSEIQYDESRQEVKDGEVSGTISFSKVTIQPSKASLKNNATKEVEFANKETNRKVVFDGTYNAKRGDIKLNEFKLEYATTALYATSPDRANVTFYLIIDGEEVADAKATPDATTNPITKYVAANTFDNVLVENGESVSVVVEAEVEANIANLSTTKDLGKYKLTIRGEDENGNVNSGKGDANTVTMKVVDKGSVTIPAVTSSKTVLLKAADANVAEFTIKPANNAEEVDLETIMFTITATNPATYVAWGEKFNDKITLRVDDVEEDDCNDATAGQNSATLTYNMNKTIGSNGVVVKLTLDDEFAGTITVNNLQVNGKQFTSRTFEKSFSNALVYFASQEGWNGTTKLTLGVDEFDSNYSTSNLRVFVGDKIIGPDGTLVAPATCTATYTYDIATDKCIKTGESPINPTVPVYTISTALSDWDTVEAVESWSTVQMVTAIQYFITDSNDSANNTVYAIQKSTYGDYFKVNGGDYAKIFKAN